MPPNTSGVAIGAICWPNSGSNGDPIKTDPIIGPPETAGFGKAGFQSADASCANETGRGSFGLLFGFSDPLLKRSIICLMGVIPAIGSFEKGKLKAIAPTSLPSINTGDPDIPAKTSVFSALAPVSLAMMADWRGPGKPGSTPRTSTPKSSVSVPWKTVFAIPFIPGRTSSRAKNWGLFAPGALLCCALIKLFEAIATKRARKTEKALFINNLGLLNSIEYPEMRLLIDAQ